MNPNKDDELKNEKREWKRVEPKPYFLELKQRERRERRQGDMKCAGKEREERVT